MGDRAALRPALSELAFSLFDVRLHPELVVAAAGRAFVRGGAELAIALAPGGHFLEWRRGRHALTECLAPQGWTLPSTRQLFAHRVGGERVERHCPAPGVRYEACFQAERLPPAVFLRLHDELLRDGGRGGLLHAFPATDRLDLPPVAYVDPHYREHAGAASAIVHTYHTFPVSFAVVKTQSLIEWPL